MPQEDAEGTGVATVVDKPTNPTAKGEATVVIPEGPVVDSESFDASAQIDKQLAAGEQRIRASVHELQTAANGVRGKRAATAPTVNDLPPEAVNLTLTTAHDALHD